MKAYVGVYVDIHVLFIPVLVDEWSASGLGHFTTWEDYFYA
jgi:hypothetical protein